MTMLKRLWRRLRRVKPAGDMEKDTAIDHVIKTMEAKAGIIYLVRPTGTAYVRIFGVGQQRLNCFGNIAHCLVDSGLPIPLLMMASSMGFASAAGEGAVTMPQPPAGEVLQ